MDRRINFLYAIPLGLALITFLLTEQVVLTALAIVVGMLILYGVRSRLMPPHVYKAARQYQRGDLEQALATADMAVDARPESWEGYYVRALIQFARPNHAAAEADARKAIELKPESATNHAILGQVLYWQERLDEAALSFERAVERDKKDPANHFYMGATLFQLGDYGRAIPHLELALALRLANPQLALLANYYLGTALEAEGHAEEAEPVFRAMEKRAKELPRLLADLQQAPEVPALMRMKRDAGAVERRLARAGESRS